MGTVEMYHLIFQICAVLAAILFVAAIVIFFVAKIPDAFMQVTGITRKKGIEKLREEGSAHQVKKFDSSMLKNNAMNNKKTEALNGGADTTSEILHQNEGRQTDRTSAEGTTLLGADSTQNAGTTEDTTLLGSNAVGETPISGFAPGDATTVLGTGMVEGTSVLGSSAVVECTSVLSAQNMPGSDTTVLGNEPFEPVKERSYAAVSGQEFVLLREITIINTQEVIPE